LQVYLASSAARRAADFPDREGQTKPDQRMAAPT
jgi:hypothetical protein